MLDIGGDQYVVSLDSRRHRDDQSGNVFYEHSGLVEILQRAYSADELQVVNDVAEHRMYFDKHDQARIRVAEVDHSEAYKHIYELTSSGL